MLKNNVFFYFMMLFMGLSCVWEVQAAGFIVKKIELDGFDDESAYGLSVDAVQKKLQQGLKRYKYRLTLDQAHSFADYLTNVYKQVGLIFYRVVVPPQEIVDFTLRLKLIKGRLGELNIRGNELYSEHRIQAPFKDLLQQPVDKDKIEEALLILNEYPGLSVFGFFSRGKGEGETRINLKVQKERFFEGSLRLDNYGVTSTGENRLLGQFSFNNPFGHADKINIGLLAAENNSYISLAYRSPLWNSRHSIGFLLTNNQFDVAGDFSSLGVNGSANIARIDFNHVLYRSHQLKQSVSWYIDSKQSEVDDELGQFLQSEQESTGVGVSTSVDISASGQQYQVYFNVYSARYDAGFSVLDGEKFSLANVTLQARFNVFDDSLAFSRLGLMLRAQVTDDLLPGYERFSLGGVNGVQALDTGIASTDSGTLVTLTWHWLYDKWLGDNAFSRHARIGLFANWVQGDVTGDDTIEEQASDYGVSLDFSWGKQVSGRITYASSLDIDLTTRDEAKSSNAYAQLTYRF